jgi:glycosyltransferase involved in cell wall biosynthesis
MDELDLYVIPSLGEGLPRALVEAMSRGLPAIGSRRGGIPELVDGRWLHRPGDDRGLARLVAGLLDDPAALQAEARRSWETAGRFTAGALEQRREALVHRFAAAAAARPLGRGAPRRAPATP